MDKPIQDFGNNVLGTIENTHVIVHKDDEANLLKTHKNLRFVKRVGPLSHFEEIP